METVLKFVPPGGYRACAACAAAKSRCIQPDDGGDGKCERCLRMGKECTINPRANKKRRRVGEENNPDFKDDNDVAAFQAGAPAPSTYSAPTTATIRRQSSTRSLKGESLRLDISTNEAEQLLILFRQRIAPYFPLQDIALATPSEALRLDKPLLHAASLFVASYHDISQQKKMAASIHSYISSHVFQQGRKSLPMLQGLYVFMLWRAELLPDEGNVISNDDPKFSNQIYVHPQFVNLLHIAMALTQELEKPDPPAGGHWWMAGGAAGAPGAPGATVTAAVQPPKSPHQSGRTMEERRALAACYFITSSISTSVNMLTSLQFSAQIDDTCAVFEQGDVNGNDFRFAKMIRLQVIIARIHTVQKDTDLQKHQIIPMALYIKSFEADLKVFWRDLPPELHNDAIILLLYHTAEIHIYKMGLGPTNVVPVRGANHDEEQEDLLEKCLMALSNFYNVYFTFPPSEYFHIPMTVFASLAHANITLGRLTSFWQGGRPARFGDDFLRFNDLMERISERYDAAKSVPHPMGFPMRNAMFDMWAHRLRSFKSLDFPAPSKSLVSNSPPNILTQPAMPAGPSLPLGQPDSMVPPPPPPPMHDMYAPTTSSGVPVSQYLPVTAALPVSEAMGMSGDWSNLFDGSQMSMMLGSPEPMTSPQQMQAPPGMWVTTNSWFPMQGSR